MHLLSLLDLQRRARANARASLVLINCNRADARSVYALQAAAEDRPQRPVPRA